MSDASRAYDEAPPSVVIDPVLRTSAGQPVSATATITNVSAEPRVIAVTSLGVDAGWLPAPTRSRPLLPGQTVTLDLTFAPAHGTVPARYPLALTVQAVDPASGDAMSSVAIADLVLVVDSPGQIEVLIDPAESTGRYRKRIKIVLDNVGNDPQRVNLEVHAPEPAEVALSAYTVDVAAGARVSVPGRIKIDPRLFGHRQRFTYMISARGSGAPRRAEAAVTNRAFLGATGPKAFALLAIVTLWAGLAIVFIPKLASTIRDSENKAADKAAAAQSSAVTKVVPGKSGAGQSGAPASGAAGSAGASGGAGGSGAGGSGSGGSGGGSGAGGANAIELSGTVAGSGASGARVGIRPTSLVDEAAQSASRVGVSAAQVGELGKIPESAVVLSSERSTVIARSTVTKKDGAWSFSAVRAPGYYLVTFAEAGYQTQRYVVDSAAAVATNPLTVTLLPGEGRLRGRIVGPAGPVGAAKITITDGTNTLTTSSTSKGDIGAWAVDGLSTPSSYLVTASKDGLSTESAIVTLPAGGQAIRNLRLVTGAASLSGMVRGANSVGTVIGLGGAQVTATDGETSRTATTNTNGDVAGNYTLPELPPGNYTVIASAAGYQQQTQRVVIKKGQGGAIANAVLTPSTGTVTGLVTGDELDSNGSPTGKRVTLGAGVILTSNTDTYKITSGSSGFRVNGVNPGTYVVTAEYAGLQSGYYTIKVLAGQTTVVPTFDLHTGTIASTSTITGFVGDGNNPNGTLCSTASNDCTITFTLRDSHGVTVAITPTSITPPAESGPTSYTLAGAAGGLAPGLYRLTIGVTLVSGSTLNGYLPATVSVQVPLNAVARAPQVNLFNASTISGTITSFYDPTGGGVYPDCVWAVPQGEALPTDCTPPPTSPCLSTGLASRSVGTIAADGTYQITDLCPGSYTMLIVVTNPDFVTPSPVPLPVVSVRDGSSAHFDGQIFRLGRIQFTLTAPDPNTGRAVVLDNATLAAGSVCNSVDLSGRTTDADGGLLVTGLAAGTYSCTLKATSSTGLSVIATITDINVTLDGTTQISTTLTAPVATFVGQLRTSWSGTAQGVPFTRVFISGVTGYTDGVPNTPTQVAVTTDARGCFAVSRDGRPPTGALPGACAGDPFIAFATVALPLALPRVSFVATVGGYQDLNLANVSVDPTVLVILNLIPNPVPFSGQFTLGGAPVQNFAATITVTKFPLGVGNLTVQADSAGVVSWRDDSLFDGQVIVPGTYTLHVTGPGLVPWDYEFTCVPGAPCIQQFAVVQLGNLVITGMQPGALVTLISSDGTTVGPKTSTGAFVTFPDLLPTDVAQGTAPTYRVHVQAAGYIFTTRSTAECPSTGPIIVAAGTTTTCNIALVPDGSVRGTVTGTNTLGGVPFSFNLDGATVTAKLCTPDATTGAATCTLATAGNIGPFTSTTNSDGTYTVTGTNQMQGLDQGQWLISAHLDGYTDVSRVVTVGALAGGMEDFALPITPVSTFSVTVSDGNGNTFTSGVTVQLYQSGILIATSSTASAAGKYDFTDVQPGSYDITVSGQTILTATDYGVVIDRTHTTHTVFVTLGASTVSGTISGQQGKDAAATPLNGVRVQIGTGTAATFAVAKGTDGKAMDTTTPTAGNGTGVFSLGNVPDSPADGWTVQMSRYGYQTRTFTGISISHVNAPTVLDETLTRVTHDVVFTVTTTADGDDVKAATGVQLTSKTNGTLTPQAAVSTAQKAPKHGIIDSWTFLAVPYGTDWQLSISLPSGHVGTLDAVAGSPAMTCTSSAPPVIVTCTSGALTVPGDGNPSTPVPVAYGLDEFLAGMSVLAVPMDADLDAQPPDMVDVEVADAAGHTVYSNTQFAVSAKKPATPTDTFWAAAGTTYTTSGSSSPVANWKLGTATLTSTAPTATISLTEIGATVKVRLVGATFPTGTTATVTLVPPAGSTITAPAAVKVASGGTATFTNVPFGTDWTAKATATYTVPDDPGPPDVPAHKVTVKGSTTFTIAVLAPPRVDVALA